jgi:hypothetical protein
MPFEILVGILEDNFNQSLCSKCSRFQIIEEDSRGDLLGAKACMMPYYDAIK